MLFHGAKGVRPTCNSVVMCDVVVQVENVVTLDSDMGDNCNQVAAPDLELISDEEFEKGAKHQNESDEMGHDDRKQAPPGLVSSVQEFEVALAAHLGHQMNDHLVLLKALFASVPAELVRAALWEAEQCSCTKWWSKRVLLQPYDMAKVRSWTHHAEHFGEMTMTQSRVFTDAICATLQATACQPARIIVMMM